MRNKELLTILTSEVRDNKSLILGLQAEIRALKEMLGGPSIGDQNDEIFRRLVKVQDALESFINRNCDSAMRLDAIERSLASIDRRINNTFNCLEKFVVSVESQQISHINDCDKLSKMYRDFDRIYNEGKNGVDQLLQKARPKVPAKKPKPKK